MLQNLLSDPVRLNFWHGWYRVLLGLYQLHVIYNIMENFQINIQPEIVQKQRLLIYTGGWYNMYVIDTGILQSKNIDVFVLFVDIPINFNLWCYQWLANRFSYNKPCFKVIHTASKIEVSYILG